MTSASLGASAITEGIGLSDVAQNHTAAKMGRQAKSVNAAHHTFARHEIRIAHLFLAKFPS
jgi:hypothetical protein